MSGCRPINGIGIGTLASAFIAGWFFGISPMQIRGLLSGNGAPPAQTAPEHAAQAPPANDAQAKFVSQMLRSTETVWTEVCREKGKTYTEPKLKLFRDSYPTACGLGQAAAGPFYCPEDKIVYLDLGFFDVMTRHLGAPGQFAHAYVIGH